MAKTFTDAMKVVNKQIQTNSIIFHNNFTALQMGDIARRTPIKEGFAKGNWDAGFSGKINPTKEKDLTKTGLRAIRKALRQLKGGLGIVNGRTSFIKNGVEGEEGGGYIIQLEHGKSKQAPLGMVLISINRAQSLAKKAFKLRGGSL